MLRQEPQYEVFNLHHSYNTLSQDLRSEQAEKKSSILISQSGYKVDCALLFIQN